ncbi:hypothetical protein HPB52_023976 [Rhipicephalus sanguineus]|uniref:Tick transposon n=1 Tax=Rhipicephalus sanguineus TaxID=34632 RepID=A0A9D4T0L5_RHISA|nr:hypothetical protein HPB52_023976 [Rhipicephalus sanguineus]
MSPTAPPCDTAAEEHPVTHDADGTNKTEFQAVFRSRIIVASAPRRLRNEFGTSALLLAPHLRPLLPRTRLPPALFLVLPIRPLRLRPRLQECLQLQTPCLCLVAAGFRNSFFPTGGADGDYTDEALLAAVTSEVPVIAARRQETSLILRFASPVPAAPVHLFRMAFVVRPPWPRPLQYLRCGRYGHTTAACRRLERCLRCSDRHGKDASCTSKVKCLHCGRPHSADSAECQLWQREQRLPTIKASAPTYLPHREVQAALRPSSSGTSGPQLNQATGKSCTAAVGARSKDPRHSGAQQRGPPAGPKKQGSAKPCPPTAVADMLPPENQLRCICLQAGGVHPRNSHHGWHSSASSREPPLLSPVCDSVERQLVAACTSCTSCGVYVSTADVRINVPSRTEHDERTSPGPTTMCNALEDQCFLDLVAAAAQAATIQSWVLENHPVPDLRQLNIGAARRRAERRYLKAQCTDHRTLFNRVDSVCRRRANRRGRQSWQGICQSLNQARGGAKASRLLRSLVIGPMARQSGGHPLGHQRNLTAIRRSVQCSLDAVTSFFMAIGLIVSPTKTKALLDSPPPPETLSANLVELGGDVPGAKDQSPPDLDTSRQTRNFQGHQGSDCCGQAVEQRPRVHPATGTSALQGGCNGNLATHRKEQLERQHRMTFRRFMGLTHQSPVAPLLADAQTWPLWLLMLRQALHHVDRLQRASWGGALLRRLRSRPASRIAQICALNEELAPEAPCPVRPPPPHQQPPDAHLELDNLSKRRTPACELHKSAVAKLHDRLRGLLLVFTGESAWDSPRSAAAAFTE